MVYDPLIFATCPHSSLAILADASSLRDRKIRVAAERFGAEALSQQEHGETGSARDDVGVPV